MGVCKEGMFMLKCARHAGGCIVIIIIINVFNFLDSPPSYAVTRIRFRLKESLSCG